MRILLLDWWRVLIVAALACVGSWYLGAHAPTWRDLLALTSLFLFGVWTTPKDWTAIVVTVADLNTHIRDNLNYLKAALDIAPALYATTKADVVSTTAQTTTMSFQVPANEMTDGSVIHIYLAVKVRSTGGTYTLSMFWGSSSVTLSTTSQSAGTEKFHLVEFKLQRVGTDLWVRGQEGTMASEMQKPFHDLVAGNTNVAVISAPTFTSTQTVALKITLNVNSANDYWKTVAARAVRLA